MIEGTLTTAVKAIYDNGVFKPKDHARVVEVFRTFQNLRLADHVLTTNHVVAETITLARKVAHETTVHLGERLYSEKLARIHWTTPDEERAALSGKNQCSVSF